jgi:hypothetical protein
MSPVDERAITEFLEAGGRVSRAEGSVPVSEPELLNYLASCGITARYRAGDSREYLCQGKRLSVRKLLAIANEHRRSLELPPLSLRVAIRYTGPRSALSRTRY